jgi:transposase
MNSLCEKITEKGIISAVIVCDNVAFHKCVNVRKAISNRGHIMQFLPRYSSFLNPIENVFSKWKGIIRAKDVTTKMNWLDVLMMR